MSENDAEQWALRRVKRKNYFICASFCLVSILLQRATMGVFTPVLVLTMLALGASFVVLGVVMGAGWLSIRILGGVTSTISIMALTVFIHATGGPSSPYFPLLPAFPLLIAMFTPDSRLPTILASGLMVGTVLVLEVLAGLPVRSIALQVSNYALLGVTAYFGARTYRRMRNAERAAQQARLVALEQLAESEHHRVSAERQRTRELQEKNEALAAVITQLHETQRQLVIQEKLASMGILTAGIAHELKNPLNFVTNFAETSRELIDELLDAANATPQGKAAGTDVLTLGMLRDSVGRILEHGQRANRIIEGMLLHARHAPASWTRAELNSVVARGVELAMQGLRARAPGMSFHIEAEYDAEVGEVELVVSDVSRVMVNLIENAVYAMAQKRQTQGASYLPALTIRTRNLGPCVELRIHDNGSGIPSHLLDKIWSPFFTTKPPGEGTGLGLSISYDIITQGHKGQMRIESTEGESTEILITLPRNSRPDQGPALTRAC